MKFTMFIRTGRDALLDTAMALHDAAMKDEYFIKRKLAPNVDFWYVLSPHFFWHGAAQGADLDHLVAGGESFGKLRLDAVRS